MRRFDRHLMDFPRSLNSEPVEYAKGEIQDYISSTFEKGGQRRAPDVMKVLYDSELLNHLWEGFGRACAFCETPSRKPNPEWMHHFRPIGLAADENKKTSLLHYVWLALEWENLYWCCPTCDRTKGNRFYVKNRRGEINDPVEVLRDTEMEELIDPCHTDPREHLQFGTNGVLHDLSITGWNTIELMNLNRGKLIENRRRAILDLADDLRDPSGAVALFAPRGEHGPSRSVLARNEVSSVSELAPDREYAGAATWAILQWAEFTGLPASTPGEFLDFVQSMDVEERHRMLNALVDDEPSFEMAAGGSPDAEDGYGRAPARPSRTSPVRSRTLTLKDLPLADNLLKSVTIRNFKALKDISFTLPEFVDDPDLATSRALRLVPCMLILGENATGKSSVLEALTLALLGTTETGHLDDLLEDEDVRPEAMIHRPDIDNWDVVSDEPLKVELTFLDSEERTELTGHASESTFSGDPRPSKIVLSYGPRRFFRKQKQRRFRAPAYRVKSQFDPLVTIPNPTDWLLNCPKPQFDAAVRALREILMLESDDDVVREDGRIMINAAGGRTPLSEMSVGYKSVVALATDIIRELFYNYDNTEFAYAVVLIDEIETHLHPRWKMRIIRLLRQAFPKVQFIITTHDPLCLRGMYDGEIYVLERSPDDARIETLKDLPNIKGMRAEQILTSEFFGLGTTDPDTDAKLSRYHTLVAKDERSASEKIEMEALHEDIAGNMVIGNTVGEQVMVEAMRKEGFDPFAPIEKVTSDTKKDMLAKALAALDSDSGAG